MKVKPEWISSERWVFLTETGKTIIVIMKLRRFLNGQRVEYPEGYKINWIAYNEDDDSEKVLFDNHHGKFLHYHIDQDKKGVSFAWTSRERIEELFWQRIQTRFGQLKKIL